jgi:LysM repeat protein
MMSRKSTSRIFLWSLTLIGTAGAVLSIDKAFRELPAEADPAMASAAILPPSSQDRDQNLTAAVQAETKNMAALGGQAASGGVGDELRPAFDIARVEPSGDAVIAGRAPPGASVELLRNGKLHDRVVADASGQFAMVPPRLPPGDSELTLRSRQPDGTLANSKENVVVALQPNLKDRPIVALMTPDKPSIVLSKPAAPDSAGRSVLVETVEAEPGGKLYVSGRSSPRAAVRLYLNDGYLASTTAGANGRFAFTVDGSIGTGGVYRVRLDEVDSGSGAIRSRAEVPFNTSQGLEVASAPSTGPPAAVAVPKVPTAVVSRGDSLWRISRAAYGDGARYTVIYDANHGQIRNPDRIYPGQVFVLPEKPR